MGGRVGLEFNPVAVIAQQMTTAQDVLVEPEEDLNRPAILENQGDDVGIQVQQICRNNQGLGLLWPPTARMHSLDMWLARHLDHPNRNLQVSAPGPATQPDHPIPDYPSRPGLRRDRPLLYPLCNIVVLESAYKGTAVLQDLLVQAILGITSIQDVDPAGLQIRLQDVLLTAIALGDRRRVPPGREPL